jgi:hypothetical protein
MADTFCLSSLISVGVLIIKIRLHIHPNVNFEEIWYWGSVLKYLGSRDSVVGIATGYGLDDGGCRSSSPVSVKNFLFSTSFRSALGPTQPPIKWVPGALFPGVKRPGREADQSLPTSAEVKKMWIYTSTPPYAFMA